MITTDFSLWLSHAIFVFQELNDLFLTFLAPNVFLVESWENHGAILVDKGCRSVEFDAQALSEAVKGVEYLVVYETFVIHHDAFWSITLCIVKYNASCLDNLSLFDLCGIGQKVQRFELKI